MPEQRDINPNLPSSRFFEDRYRLPVEQIVSQVYGVNWRVKKQQGMDDLASHPAAILSDGDLSVFVKLSDAANAIDQFEVELAGLQFLSERAGILTPALIGMIPVENSVLLILEGLRPVERTPERWREIGRTLAQIHQIKGGQFGYEKQGYFGPLYQDNRPLGDWKSFFMERRLWPRLIGAIDSGNLPTESIRQIERLISRLPDILIPDVEPALLHGDAQQNNFIATEQGVYAIDPAVHYGNPEVDLAFVDYFAPVPEDVFSGYRELLPIDPGFRERRDLWRIPAYLAAVTVEGAIHLDKLTNAVRGYL